MPEIKSRSWSRIRDPWHRVQEGKDGVFSVVSVSFISRTSLYNSVAKIMAYHALGRPDCTIRFIAYIPRQYCYGNFGKKILGEWEIYQKRGGVCCLDI